MATSFTLTEAPYFIDGAANIPSYPAIADRRAVGDPAINGPGIMNNADCLISFVSGRNISVAAGDAWVLGGNITKQGMYRCVVQSGAPQITFDAGDANDRIDQVILRVYDHPADGSGLREGRVEIAKGAAQAGATLDNRLGAADLTALAGQSRSVLLLYDQLVRASATTISASDGRDRRTYAANGLIPNLGSIASPNMVSMVPHPALTEARVTANGARYAGRASLALCYLPKSITASRLRWTYQQDDTPVGSTRTWMIAILDATGRLIARTPQVAFAGTAGVKVNVNQVWSSGGSFFFPGGAYYVWMGLGTQVGATEGYLSQFIISDSTNQPGSTPQCPNVFFSTIATALPGSTFPSSGVIDLANYGDRHTTGTSSLPVPIVVLGE